MAVRGGWPGRHWPENASGRVCGTQRNATLYNGYRRTSAHSRSRRRRQLPLALYIAHSRSVPVAVASAENSVSRSTLLVRQHDTPRDATDVCMPSLSIPMPLTQYAALALVAACLSHAHISLRRPTFCSSALALPFL